MPRAHLLLVTLGSAGDMHPFLGLARSLMARGHRVTLLGPASHAAMAATAGVCFEPLGTVAQYEAALRDPDLWHPRKGFGVIWRHLSEGLFALRDLVAALPADPPCLLVAHPLALPAAALARTARPDLRIVGAYLAPSNLRSSEDPLTIGPLKIPPWVPMAWRRALWRLVDACLLDPVALPDLNAARAAAGLTPAPHFFEHLMTAPDLSLTLFPAWFAPTPGDWPQPLCSGQFPLFDPHPGPRLSDELAAFLAQGGAPVVFTPGTGNQQAADYFGTAVAVTRRIGRRAILLTPHRQQVPARLPEGISWQGYVPLRLLLPHVAALVHHGGIGTTAEALRAGVPQLVLPWAFDQFDNAARVQALAVGRSMPASRAKPRQLAAALRALLGSAELQSRCREVAARFEGTPSNDAACAGIEALLDPSFRRDPAPAAG